MVGSLIQKKRYRFASLSKGGKIHRVEHLSGEHYLIMCRGFAPVHESRLPTLQTQKPIVKACAKIKNQVMKIDKECIKRRTNKT